MSKILTVWASLIAIGIGSAKAAELALSPPQAHLEAREIVYGQRVRGLSTALTRVDAEATAEASWGESLGARLSPWTWLLAPRDIAGQPRTPRVFAELKEGWVEYRGDWIDLRAGNQIVAWGSTDVVSPVDVWNPRDQTDLFVSPKLPFAALRAVIHPVAWDPTQVELLVTPFFRESVLPTAFPETGTVTIELSESRWLLPVPSRALVQGTAANLTYELAAPSYPATWQAGARARTSLGGWDFAVSAYAGVEKLPRVHVAQRGNPSIATVPVVLTLNPSFHREGQVGLDGTGPLTDDLTVRFDAAFRYRDNARAATAATQAVRDDLTKSNFVHATVGVDGTLRRPVLGATLAGGLLYVHYQRLGSSEADAGASVVTGLPESLPWDRNVAGYVEARWQSKWKLSVSGVWDVRRRGYYVSPGGQWQWTDPLRFAVAGDLFSGDSTSFFGQYRDNRRLRLSAVLEL